MRLLVLFTDFGLEGPYVGQLQIAASSEAPGVHCISLMADAPKHNVKASAYLLASLIPQLPAGAVLVGVVDPGVGTALRVPVALNADGRWFVGPGNGLFDIVGKRANEAVWHRITWQPPRLSASFHGRDLFTPIGARLASGKCAELERMTPPSSAWPDDLAEIIYIDGFGNAMTGLRALGIPEHAQIAVTDRRIPHARTFADVPVGSAFWYANSNGLVEIAVNQGRADRNLNCAIGTPLQLLA